MRTRLKRGAMTSVFETPKVSIVRTTQTESTNGHGFLFLDRRAMTPTLQVFV